MNFFLPDNCKTCGTEYVSREISRKYSVGIERSEYKCGARYSCYLTHKRLDVDHPCPQDPKEQVRIKRVAEIDAAIAAALNKARATWDEVTAFVRRAELDRLGCPSRGMWPLLNAKKPDDR